MRTIRTRLGAAFAAVLLLGGLVAPAAADHSPEHDALQQAVTDAQAAYDAASAAYDDAFAQYVIDQEAYQAAHAAYLVELAAHEAAVADAASPFDCNENAQNQANIDCRADRDAAVAAVGPPPVAPSAPTEPSSAERDELLVALNLAIAALEAYGAEGDQAQQGQLGDPVDSVDICHATSSVQNPYNAQNVSVDSILRPNGHATHTGPVFDPDIHDQQNRGWGDIIPPFVYLDGDQVVEFSGLNWADGQALWGDDCGEGGGFEPEPVMDFEVTVSDEDLCLGDEVTFTGTNDGDTDVIVTGTLTLPDNGTMPLYYEVAAGGSFTLTDTPNQLGIHTVELDWADDYDNSGSVTLTVDVEDCSQPGGNELGGGDPIVVEVAPVIAFDATSVCVADAQVIDYLAGGTDWDQGTLVVAYGDGQTDELALVSGNTGQLAWPLDGELPAGSVTVTFTADVDGELEEVFAEVFVLDEECGAEVEGIVEVDDSPGRSGEAPVGRTDGTQVLGAVETLPETGASAIALVLVGLLSLLSGGALLRRRPSLEG